LLLAQDCLQRFEDVAGALEWCRKRPVEGEQSFVLADAGGAVATVVVSGRERRVQSGEGELYLEGGELPESAEGDAAGPEGPSDRVLLDPKARRLQIDAVGATIEIEL
jgi:hypothetical protein